MTDTRHIHNPFSLHTNLTNIRHESTNTDTDTSTQHNRLQTVTVSWSFTSGETPTSPVWINLLTQTGTTACGYAGYTQAYVQGSVAILQTQVSGTTTYTWTIPNNAYQSIQCVFHHTFNFV